jgi:hypothetical protein
MVQNNISSGKMMPVTGSFINSSHFHIRGENMKQTTCDKKGRIYLRGSVRAKYGDKFVMLEAPGELVLLPVPKDPVKDLEKLGKPLQHLSLREIKRIIERRARQEVGL